MNEEHLINTATEEPLHPIETEAVPQALQANSLELKEKIGHRWWGWTLFLLTLASPPMSLIVLQGLGSGLLLSFLALSLCLPVLNFFRALVQYDHNAYHWITSGAERPADFDEWQNVTWDHRISALLRGLIRLEFFGWIVWVSASGAAIAGALQKNQITFAASAATFMAKWSFLMNEAAFDLIRATVIGTIVLFFAQLIRKFQNTIDKADLAARSAHSAAAEANSAVTRAYDLIPLLNDNIERTVSVLKTSYRILESETLSHHLARTLEVIANSHPALKQVEELSGRIVARISQINEEITHSYLKDAPKSDRDPFDLLTLSAIYTTYLKVETLSFEGMETGGKACRLSTRYPHYALAVRSVVKALESLNDGRYRYYTIFNRAPEHFFNPENPNIENPLGNINWSFLFLEEFCRWHNSEKIPYTRYFVTLDDDSRREGHIPPTYSDIRQKLPDSYILCFRAGEWRPFLWGDSAWSFFSAVNPDHEPADIPAHLKMYSNADLESMKKTAKMVIPPPDIQQTLKLLGPMLGLSDPSYIIVRGEKRKQVERVVKNIPDIQLRPLKEILSRYHNSEIRPQVLKVPTWGAYQRFFGELIPRDLFAVWDCENKRWCLCIGTMAGESDPTAVEMICTSRDRQLLALPWSNLEEKLTTLFCEDPTELENCEGISREEL